MKSLVFRRSIYATKDIAAGEVFTEENIRIVSPGNGAAPKFYNQLLGQISYKLYAVGEPIDAIIG